MSGFSISNQFPEGETWGGKEEEGSSSLLTSAPGGRRILCSFRNLFMMLTLP